MGVGAFILALGVVFLVLTFLKITPNQSWIISWINNYVIGSIGVVVGMLLLGYGIYTRKVLGAYVEKVERLEQVKAEQAQRLRQKTIALKKKEVEVERKEATLRLTKGQLRISRKEAERKTAQMYRVRGKLGDRSKRLKRIEEIAKVKKKK
jgi:uncharacterized protein (UPF0335 family)